MSQLSDVILDEVRSYEVTPDIGVEIRKGKGLFNRRKVIHVFGTVRSEDVRNKIAEIAEKHAGDRFDTAIEVKVKHRSGTPG